MVLVHLFELGVGTHPHHEFHEKSDGADPAAKHLARDDPDERARADHPEKINSERRKSDVGSDSQRGLNEHAFRDDAVERRAFSGSSRSGRSGLKA